MHLLRLVIALELINLNMRLLLVMMMLLQWLLVVARGHTRHFFDLWLGVVHQSLPLLGAVAAGLATLCLHVVLLVVGGVPLRLALAGTLTPFNILRFLKHLFL